MPATFEAREARTRGCSPLVTPKKLSRCKNASRFAKRIFLHLSDLLLRSKLHAFAGRKVLLRRDTLGEAVNRRNVKKALSEAASFFPFRPLHRDYQGRAALDSCLPRLESSGCFSGSLLARKRELIPVTNIAPASACYPPQNPAASASAASTRARRRDSPSGI